MYIHVQRTEFHPSILQEMERVFQVWVENPEASGVPAFASSGAFPMPPPPTARDPLDMDVWPQPLAPGLLQSLTDKL